MTAARASSARTAAPAAARPPVMRRALRDSYALPPLASLSAIPATAAVQRKCSACEREERMPVQPRLEVGPPGDRYEREADTIATRVLAMRESAVSPAGAAVQRACAACAAEAKDDNKDKVHARRDDDDTTDEVKVRAQRDDGAETIAASDTQLTSGGAPLPDATRGFFEDRMGRDLGDVRIHQGGGSQALNEQIAARAFTYRNHIWLGASERADTGFTMAHELAHVMQQTAPGPVGPAPQRRAEVSAASPAVQRVDCDGQESNLFFAPNSKTKLASAHDDFLTSITTQDASLLGEVPIPNANTTGLLGPRSGCGALNPGEFGRADLYQATNNKVIGFGFKEVKGADNIPRPWSSPDFGTMGCTTTGKARLDPAPITFFANIVEGGAKRSGKRSSDTAPTWDGATGSFDNAGSAPGTVAIGEVKFGGTPNPRKVAGAQIDAYLEGIKFTHKGYENIRNNISIGSNELQAGKKPTLPAWTLSSATRLTKTKFPDGWTVLTPGQTLVMAKWTKSIGAGGRDQWEARRCDGTPEFSGEFYGGHDSGMPHVWLYAWYPTAKAPGSTAKGSAKYTGFNTTATELMADVKAAGDTKASAAPKQLKLFPRRHANALPGRASRLRPTVARKPRAEKPIPKVDLFKQNYEAWKTKRETLAKDFKGYSKTDEFGADISSVLFNKAVANTSDITKTAPNSKVAVDTSASAKTASRDLWLLELMAGPAGKVLGTLRYYFGTFFLSIMSAVEKIKAKFASYFAEKPASSGGGLKGTAIKVFSKILGAVARYLLPQIADSLVDCVKTGVRNTIDSWIEDSPLADLETKLKGYLAQAEKLKDDVFGEVTKFVDGIFGPFKEDYEKVKAVILTVADIVGLAKKAFNAARALACLAGGLETAGIACIVGAVDALLGLFDLSPSELLLASLLGTCAAQKIFAEAMLKIDQVKRLPRTIARKIVETVKPKLPSWMQALICDPATMDSIQAEMPDISDVTCGAGGSDAGVPEGKNWKVPDGVDPKMLNRKPTKEELAGGRFDIPGATKDIPPDPAPPPVNPPAPPAGTPPAGGGGTGDAGGGTADTRVHDVKPGTLSGDLKTVNVNFYVHGIGGGFAAKDYGGKIMTVKITATDSNGVQYGPDTVEIEVHKVYPDPSKTGVYKIEFQPKIDYVLSSDTTSLGFVRKMRTGQVGSQM